LKKIAKDPFSIYKMGILKGKPLILKNSNRIVSITNLLKRVSAPVA